MRSLITDTIPYKQGLRVSLDFGSFLSANRTSNVRVGSEIRIRDGTEPGRFSAGRPTFTAERLQCGGLPA